MLLLDYIDERVAIYQTRDKRQLERIDAETNQGQTDLWEAVQEPATAQPNAVISLDIEGMNDVLNSQGYTQAAWWNCIPTAASLLMFSIALRCNFMVGYGDRSSKVKPVRPTRISDE